MKIKELKEILYRGKKYNNFAIEYNEGAIKIIIFTNLVHPGIGRIITTLNNIKFIK